MLIAIAIIALAVAGTLLAVGLRGRRTDDHPLCRRCGFDLTGRSADTMRCGECGADLSAPGAIRIGHRARRRAWIAAGLCLLGPALLPLAVGEWARWRGVNLAPYEPAWWLRHDLGGERADRDVALVELSARATAGQLAASDVDRVADRALAAQASADPWDPAWGAFIEAAHFAHRLDGPRWATYLRQGFDLSLSVDPAARGGATPPLYVTENVFQRRRCAATVVGFFDVRDLRIDGIPAAAPSVNPEPGAHDGRLTSYSGGFTVMSNRAQIADRVMRRLTVGTHRLTATLRIEIYDAADLPPGHFGRSPPTAGTVAAGSVDVAKSCDVVVNDPASR